MQTPEYNPQSFSDIYDSEIGKPLWEFLNTEPIWDLMKLATELMHPAVEGIGDKLLEKFGDQVKNDRVKQAIGHMVRSIMENHGYILKGTGLKCRKKTELFAYGSRYVKFSDQISLFTGK